MGCLYKYPELQNNRGFTLESMKYQWFALQCISRKLRDDTEVVLQAVKQNGSHLLQ